MLKHTPFQRVYVLTPGKLKQLVQLGAMDLSNIDEIIPSFSKEILLSVCVDDSTLLDKTQSHVMLPHILHFVVANVDCVACLYKVIWSLFQARFDGHISPESDYQRGGGIEALGISGGGKRLVMNIWHYKKQPATPTLRNWDIASVPYWGHRNKRLQGEWEQAHVTVKQDFSH